MTSYFKSLTNWFGYTTSTPIESKEVSIPGQISVVDPLTISLATYHSYPIQDFHVGKTNPYHWTKKQWGQYQTSHI